MSLQFDVAMAPEPLGGGRYGVEIDPDWQALAGPNGGYIAALMTRAFEAEVADPQRAARSLTCHFLRPPHAGPCEIHVTVERTGRNLTTLTARLVQDDRPASLAIAAFGKDFPGTAELALPMPDVPGPSALSTTGQSGGGLFGPPIADRIAVEQLFGPPPFSAGAESLTGGWTRLADPRPTDAAVIALYSDGWVPPLWAQSTEPILVPTIDLTVHFRAPLPHDPDPQAATLARFVSRAAQHGFVEADGVLWAADGTLLAQSRQLAAIVV